MPYQYFKINAMQFSLLKQSAVHMVSLLQVGLTRMISYFIEIAIKIVFLIIYKSHYNPGIEYAISSISEYTSECTKNRPICNENGILLLENFCDTHLFEGTYIRYWHVWYIFFQTEIKFLVPHLKYN